jgi:hypothetical protein
MIHRLKLVVSFIYLVLFAPNLGADDINQTTQIKPKQLYAKYLSYPNIVYTKEQFSTKIGIQVLLDINQTFSLSTDFTDIKDIQKLTTDIIWYKTSDTKYETTLKYKVDNKKFKLPNIKISLLDGNNTVLDTYKLKSPKIIYRKIAINQQRYSNILATSLKINSIRTKQYTNNKLLSLISISAINSNLEEFYLSKYKNQGSKDLTTKDGVQTLYYYLIIPSHTKTIKFEYYNTKLNEFVLVQLPISLKEELVSTQTDINPYQNNSGFYKRIGLIIIVFIFLMLYFFKKKKGYLAIAIFFMTFLLNMVLPKDKIVLPKDTKVYILPTYNSTVYKIIDTPKEVEVLIKQKNFTKVLFKNNQLGWIKNG